VRKHGKGGGRLSATWE